MNMAEVIGIGAALFDILMTADGFPKEDSKLQGTGSKTQCGGPCATALVAMSRLGVRTEYAGTLGDDEYGRRIQEAFRKYGVGTERIRIVRGAQSFHSFVLLNTKNSSRTCIWSKGTVPPPEKHELDLERLKAARYLHLDGHQIEMAVYAAQKAREYGVKVSLDAGGIYPGIERLLPFVDILIPSEEFALKYTGAHSAVEAAKVLEERFHPEILIVTQGIKGGFYWHQGAEIRYPSYAVPAVDSNGAGDVFHGAFLAGRLKGMEVGEAAGFASAVSALKCTRFGAQEGIPDHEETMRFIKSYD